MEIVKVNLQELNNYVLTSNKPHFMQTGAWGEVNKKRGSKAHYLLIKDNNTVIGSAMLLEKKVLKYSTFYCPRGFITDFDNKDNIKTITELLTKYVKDNNGLYLKIDPDIIIRKLNSNAEPIEEYKNKIELVDYLKSLGYKHRGFTVRLNETSAPRFTFRVDVTKDDLLESFHQTTRNLLKRNNPYNLKIYVGNENDLDKFYLPMKETAIRKKMYLEDISYFSNFYKELKKYDMADLYLVSVNIDDLKNTYNSMIENTKEELKSLENSNKKGKINDLNDQLVKYNKELKQINEINEKELILSSMINAKFGDYVWTIHGANSNKLSFLNANYEMYYQILKDAKKDGYKYVDFYGTEGVIDKSSEVYGIYNFKVRFGGDFDEFIGEFDYITSPSMYNIIMSLLKIRRRIKYRIQLLKNK